MSTAPLIRTPDSFVELLIKYKISFSFDANRHSKDNPGRQPYWSIYVDRHEKIRPAALTALAEAGFEYDGGFSVQGRW